MEQSLNLDDKDFSEGIFEVTRFWRYASSLCEWEIFLNETPEIHSWLQNQTDKERAKMWRSHVLLLESLALLKMELHSVALSKCISAVRNDTENLASWNHLRFLLLSRGKNRWAERCRQKHDELSFLKKKKRK